VGFWWIVLPFGDQIGVSFDFLEVLLVFHALNLVRLLACA